MPEADSAEVTELEDIDVHEVSLVDAPAIRRKFLIIKREDPMSDTTDAIATSAEAATDVVEEAPQTDDADVAKAEEADVAEAVETEPTDPAAADVQKDEDAVAEVEAAADVQKDEDAVAEVEADVDIEKAKRMTSSRLAKLNQMYKELGDLLKDLQPPIGPAGEPQSQPNDGGVPNTPGVVTYAAKDESGLTDLVRKAVDDAIQPLVELIKAKKAKPGAGGGGGAPAFLKPDVDDDEEDEEGKGKGKKATKKDAAAEDATASESADPAVAELRKRLSELEATSSAGTSNSTDTITKNTQTIWTGII